MEQAFLRFPHLSEAIFDSLDDKSLFGCKEVSKYWYVYLDVQKFLETRIIKSYIKNVEEAVVMVQKIYFESRCRQKKEMKTRKTEKDARFKIQLFNARSKIETFLRWYDKKEFNMVFYDCLSNCAINCLDIQTYIHKLVNDRSYIFYLETLNSSCKVWQLQRWAKKLSQMHKAKTCWTKNSWSGGKWNYEQLLIWGQFFLCFGGQILYFIFLNIVASALKSCIKWS